MCDDPDPARRIPVGKILKPPGMIIMTMGKCNGGNLRKIDTQCVCITNIRIRIAGIQQDFRFTVFYIIANSRFSEVILINKCLLKLSASSSPDYSLLVYFQSFYIQITKCLYLSAAFSICSLSGFRHSSKKEVSMKISPLFTVFFQFPTILPLCKITG